MQNKPKNNQANCRHSAVYYNLPTEKKQHSIFLLRTGLFSTVPELLEFVKQVNSFTVGWIPSGRLTNSVIELKIFKAQYCAENLVT